LRQKRLVLLAALATVTLACAVILLVSKDAREVLRSFTSGDMRPAAPRGFVTTDGARFSIDGRPFHFVGANVAVMYGGEPAHMTETLDAAARDGLRVIRVWAHGEIDERDSQASVAGHDNSWLRANPFRRAPDEWNEAAFVHLDRVLVEAAHRGLRVQLCLSNWWPDTGGVTQYLAWAGIRDAFDRNHPHNVNTERAMLFYTNEETRRLYREHIEKIVTRRNTVTGVLYRDDPVIMGYELMNEAQAPTGRWAERRAWVAEMSAYIKSLDPDHLIAPGTWGYRTSWERREWLEEHRIPTIDYCDVHNYPRDDHDSFVDSPEALREFLDNRAAAAFSLNKPFLVGEFGMGPEGYKGFSEVEWYRAFFESSLQSGAGGAMFWIITPDPHRGYGITYTTPRDETVRAEIRRAAELFAAHQEDAPPKHLLDASSHLVPRQFSFTRTPDDPITRPEIILPGKEGGAILYRFTPEMALSARFEKMGGGMGYIWGSGVGQVEYLLPARDKGRWVKNVVVRAHVQPVLPADAHPPVVATSVTLLVNGIDCGSRLVAVEDAKQAIVEEWIIDSMRVRMLAGRGLPLIIRFAVQVDADAPFGLNISNYAESHNRPDQKPIEVEVN
jgi:mannan endo-1,4-beta-mannosidase